MSFLWPQMLWLLAAVPILAGGYVLLLRRRKKFAVRYSDLAMVREALGTGQRLRRHLPPLLFLMAMAIALFGIARPTAVVTLPSEQRQIILAIDVSLSMRAADVQPSRIAAAQAAAKAFVQEQPADVRIGIVSFAGTAALVQSPTRDREDLIAAIDRFELQRHTAIGSGIIVALATLFPDERIEVESAGFSSPFSSDRGRSKSLDQPSKEPKMPAKVVPPGSYQNGAIILLTDGRRTMGPDPIKAARLAADHGVRIYTVGFGTAGGAHADVDGMSIFMRFDEEALKAIAEVTQGQYFHAGSADDLRKVYEMLNARFVLEKKETEITALTTAVASLMLVAAATLSLLWTSRLA